MTTNNLRYVVQFITRFTKHDHKSTSTQLAHLISSQITNRARGHNRTPKSTRLATLLYRSGWSAQCKSKPNKWRYRRQIGIGFKGSSCWTTNLIPRGSRDTDEMGTHAVLMGRHVSLFGVYFFFFSFYLFQIHKLSKIL